MVKYIHKFAGRALAFEEDASNKCATCKHPLLIPPEQPEGTSRRLCRECTKNHVDILTDRHGQEEET